MPNTLLVEEGWHATLYLARALADAGHYVTVVTANGTRARCRRGRVTWTSGPPVASDAFLPHLAQAIARAAIDHVLPLTEAAMIRLWDAAGPWTARLFPATEAAQRALLRDKHAMIAAMAARGIAVPARQPVRDDLALPVVLKGATGSGGARVRIATTPDELAAALRDARALGGAWVAEEHLPGPTFLVGGVFSAGAPLRLYAAEKLAQFPARTGGAIHVRSTTDPALVALGARVMRELAWTGAASIDAMRRADGSYVLLEVNPRLWGSLAGARAAGVELFAPLVELLAGGAPRAELAFAADAECWIFPRYLNDASHRTWRGARQAVRDWCGPQGRDWRDPRLIAHTLHRLYWMAKQRAVTT